MRNHKRDIEILRNGPVTMYHNNQILNEDLNWLSDHHYEVFDMNCNRWTKRNFHKKIKEALFFPDYYGENINAFNDCLSNMFNSQSRGLVLIFRNFDHLMVENKAIAESMLHTITNISRNWLVEGQKLICLIHSRDPRMQLVELGGISPSWNDVEWFDVQRMS